MSCLQNVQDQFKLWQDETRRVVSESATCYSQFDDEELYRVSLATAVGHKTILWHNSDGPNVKEWVIVVRRSGEGGGRLDWGLEHWKGRGREGGRDRHLH